MICRSITILGKLVNQNSLAEELAGLLREVAEVHHNVFRINDGVDPDWASWYSDWLVTLSELPELLGEKPARTELTCFLVSVDREYQSRSHAEPWERFYADRLVKKFT